MGVRTALATVPAIIALWLGIGAYLHQNYRTDMEETARDTRNFSHAFEENIRRTVEAIDTTIRAVRVARANDPAHFDIQAWEQDSGLTRELTLQVSFADRLGNIVTSNLGPTAKPVSIADREHFRVPRDTPGDQLFISRPVLGRVSNRWSVQFVRKVYDANGRFDGVIVASLDPAFLSRFSASLHIGRGALLLTANDGIVRSVAPVGVSDLSADLSQTRLMAGVQAESQGTLETNDLKDGLSRIFSWRRVDPYGLVVVVGLSTADALAPYQRDLRVYVTTGILLTLITLLVGMALARNRRDLVRSREILRAAVDNISQGLFVVDSQRLVPVMNKRAAELLDLPPHLAKPGIRFDDLLNWQVESGEFNGPDAERVRALVRAGGIELGNSIYQRTRQNGAVLEFRTQALESGLAVRTITDITEQQHTAQVLAEARDAAEAAARARSDFLAVMSHEIRTPLNGVIGVAGLLEDMELGSAQRDYVRLIRESGDHLLELINDILDFSRLDAARVQLEEIDFDPAALLQGVADLFQAQAGIKDLRLTATTGNMPRMVVGDPGRLRQVLLNLVGNAIKFTDKGWVKMTLAAEPVAEHQVRLAFSIADSGIGIAPEAIERMFQEFTQVDGSISRRFGGSGLGLAICRRLVELMGGTITVASEPGAGSNFRFNVTLRTAPSATEIVATPGQAVERQIQRPLRVLLAEDNATNQVVALRLLERLGHQGHAVGNGAAAVAALERSAYDLVLMDVMMPEMDGLTATRKIRLSEPPGAHITIVGLTAGSRAENLSDCLEAGMDAATTKPVTIARLRAAIAEARARSTPPPPVPPVAPSSRLRELADELGEELVAEIVRTFAEDTRLQLTAMHEAASRGDGDALYRMAHSLAGAARNVGADALAVRASALEQGVGSLGRDQMVAEINAMQIDLDAALLDLGVGQPQQA